MKKIVSILLALGCAACVHATDTVHLKGKFEGMKSPVRMAYAGASSALGDSRTTEIPTDAEGNFDITLPLDGPGYYTIARSILWLTPGDDLQIELSPNQAEATFSGRGAEANQYLTGRLFPHAGSFLRGGRNMRGDFDSTRAMIDSLAVARQAELGALKNVSEAFRTQEKARIIGDQVNSYLNYPNYLKGLNSLSEDSVRMVISHYTQLLQPLVNGKLKQLTDERLLDVDIVRYLMCMARPPWFDVFYEGVELPTRTRELVQAVALVRKLSGVPDAQTLADARAFEKTMTQPDFKRELDARLSSVKLLGKGSPAIDLELESPDGTKSRLSDLKGRVLCIDLWATWCGPCMKEAPYFAGLAEKLKGLPVAFVQISTDKDVKAWQNFLAKKGHGESLQFISHDKQIGEGWQVSGIPRFILIDKDFKVIAADAPRPSTPALEELIRANLP